MRLFYTLILFITATTISTAQSSDVIYMKLDSIARKSELNLLSKGVEYFAMLNTYGKENQPSTHTAIWREGKAHFIAYTKISNKGIISTEKKPLKASSFFSDVNHYLSDTLTKPTPYPVSYASHFSLNTKLKKSKNQDVFDATAIGVELSYSSTEIFKLIEKYLKQSKLLKL